MRRPAAWDAFRMNCRFYADWERTSFFNGVISEFMSMADRLIGDSLTTIELS